MGSACSRRSTAVEQYQSSPNEGAGQPPRDLHTIVAKRIPTESAAQPSLDLVASHKCPPDVPAHAEVDVIIGLMAKSLYADMPAEPLEYLVGFLQRLKDVAINESSRYSSGVSTVNSKSFTFYPADYAYAGGVDQFLGGLGGKHPYEVTMSVVSDADKLWESPSVIDVLETFPDGSTAYQAYKDSIKRKEARISVQQIFKDLSGISLERSDVLQRTNELLRYASEMFGGNKSDEKEVSTIGGDTLDLNRLAKISLCWEYTMGEDDVLERAIDRTLGDQLDFSKIPTIEDLTIKRYLEVMGLDPNDPSLRFIACEALQAPPPPGWSYVQRKNKFILGNCSDHINPSHAHYKRIINRMKSNKIDPPMDIELGSVDEWVELWERFIFADENTRLVYLNALDEWGRMKHEPSVSEMKELVLKCFAQLIGVDLRKSPLDVWIVIEGLTCEVPGEWAELKGAYFQHLVHGEYRQKYHPCLFEYKWIARHSNLFTKRSQEFKEQVHVKVENIRKLLAETAPDTQKALWEFDQLYQLLHVVQSLRNIRLWATRTVHDAKAKAFCERCFSEIEAMQDDYWKSRASASRIDKILATVSFVIRALDVKHFRSTSPNFSKDDFMAIYLYTAELPDLDEQIWFAMNKAMRENTKTQVELFRPLISKLDKALANLKGNACTVYRGIKVRIDKENLYRVGNSIYWNAFSSSSTSTDVAKSFSFNDVTGSVGTLFIIQSISSRSIALFSAYPEEEEYLFPSNTLFEIVGVIPESHLQLLSCNSDIVSMREVRPSEERRLLTPQESILEKLRFSQKIQFVYEDFLMQFICPDARFAVSQESNFPLVPYMQSFATYRPTGGRRGLRACVIGSPPGGGKSTLGIWVVSSVQKNNYTWNTKQGRTAVPFFISLPSLQGGIFDECAIVRSLQSQYQLSAGEMQTLRDEFELG